MKAFRYLIIGCLYAAVVFATKIQFSNQYIFHDIGIHDPGTPYWEISKIQNNFSNTHFAVLTPNTRLRLIHHQFSIYMDSGDSVLNYVYRYRYYLCGEVAPEWTILAPHYFGQFIHVSGFWYGLWSLDSVNLFQLPLDTGHYYLEFSHMASVVGTGGDTLTKTYILPDDLPFCSYFTVREPLSWGYEDSARSIVSIQQDGYAPDSLYLWNFGFGDGDAGFFNACNLGNIGQDGSLYLEDLYCRTWGNVDACSYFYRIYEESATDTPAFSIIQLEQDVSDVWSGDSLHISLTADRAIGNYYLEIYGCISHNDSVQGDLFDCPENDVYRAVFDIDSEGQGTEPASPITLNFLHAEANNGVVELNWETATETENSHFLVYRDNVVIGQMAGNGTCTEPHDYTFVDDKVKPGVHEYAISDVTYGGEEVLHDAVSVEVGAVITEADFVMNAAYPNPFNPRTVISMHYAPLRQGCAGQAAGSKVEINIYDTNGALVEELVNGYVEAGSYKVTWNAVNMPSGVYIVRMMAGNSIQSQKIVLMK